MHCCLEKCALFLYADDSTLVHAAASKSLLAEHLNDDLLKFYAYCVNNALLINNSKTEIMYFAAPNIHDSILLGNTAVDMVETFTILGLVLDRNLKFRSQVSHVTKKLNSASYIMRKYRGIIPRSTLVLLFNSIGSVHLDFNLISYFDCLNANLIADLSRSYINCGRAILASDRYTSGTVVLNDLGWLPLNARAHDLKVKFINKLVKTRIPCELNVILQRVHHSYSTRYASYGFTLNRTNKQLGSSSFASWGPRLASTLAIA